MALMVKIRLFQVFLLLEKLRVLQSMAQTDLVLTHYLISSSSVEELLIPLKTPTHQARLKKNYLRALEKSQSPDLTNSDMLRVLSQLLRLDLLCKRLCRDTLLFSEDKIFLRKVARSSMKSLTCIRILT